MKNKSIINLLIQTPFELVCLIFNAFLILDLNYANKKSS